MTKFIIKTDFLRVLLYMLVNEFCKYSIVEVIKKRRRKKTFCGDNGPSLSLTFWDLITKIGILYSINQYLHYPEFFFFFLLKCLFVVLVLINDSEFKSIKQNMIN